MNHALKYLVTFIFFGLFSSFGLTHEGHLVPGASQLQHGAQHGGTVKATSEVYFELTASDSTLKLYPMTHEFKPIPLSELKLKVTAQIPRQPKHLPIEFSAHSDANPRDSYFMGTFAPNNVQNSGKSGSPRVHRYSLHVNVEYKGKTEKLIFQVEP